jgi:CheY-like chemotaxis protein
LLAKSELTPRQLQRVQQILVSGQHLLKLIDEVLNIARVESGRMSLSLEPVALGDAVQRAIGLVRPLADEKKQALQNRIEANDATFVRADMQRLLQVLLNLLSNGVKYSGEDTTLTIFYTAAPGDRICLSIKDQGQGLSNEQTARLFSPFVRLGAEQTSIEGTGLGLVLCKRLVEAMGGLIGVESTPGHGSTFWIELAQVAPPARLEGAESLAPAASRENAHTILYIEDNLANLKVVEQIIDEYYPARLLTTMQGQIGLDLARRHHPDLILLDSNLPDIDGNEVLRRLRAEAVTAAIPVVVISADLTRRQIDQMIAAGARAYLTKPLQVNQFLNILSSILGAAPNGKAANEQAHHGGP